MSYWSWIDKQRGPRPQSQPYRDAFALSMINGTSRPSWSPASLSTLVQRFADQQTGYHANTYQSYPILKPEETGTVAQPRAGYCALFDGNDYASLGANVGVTTDLTVCAWIKLPNYSSYQMIAVSGTAASGAGFDFRVDLTTGKLQLYWNSSLVSSPSAVGTGAWVHVAATRNSSGAVALYVNGSQVATGTAAGTPSGSYLTNFMLGTYDAGSIFFNGSMYDVRVYSVVKSPTEILAITNQHLTPSTVDATGALGIWPLQEEAGGNGTLHYDVSGNGRHLTKNNITASTYNATDTGVKFSHSNEKGYTIGRNMLARSQEFSTSAPWNSDGGALVFTPNSTTAPDGTTTAETVTFNNGGLDFFYQLISSITAGTRYTFSIYLKALSGTVNIGLRESATNTWQVVTATTTWQRFTLTFTSSTAINIGMDQRAVAVTGATAVGSVYVWGAQLELGSSATDYQATGASGYPSNLIIPASLSTPTQDAAGNALGVVGPVAYPTTTEVQAFTGDGTAAFVDCGSALLPPTANHSGRLLYYHVTNNSTIRNLIAQRKLDGSGTGFVIAVNNTASSNLTLAVIDGSPQVAEITAALTAGAWHLIEWSRVDSAWQLDCTPIGGAKKTATCTLSLTLDTSAGTRLSYNVTGSPGFNDGRFASLSITTGGVTKYPLFDQCGPGSANTNRDFYILCSDGTSTLVTGGIVSGTIANIYANRCPYVQDWCVNYGGSCNTNLLSYTEVFSDAAWVKADVTITANTINGPTGTLTADLVTEGTAGTAIIRQTITGQTASIAYTGSIHLKRGNTDWVRLINEDASSNGGRVWVNLATGALGTANNYGTGTVGTPTITDVGDGWYRVTLPATSGTTSKRFSINTAASDTSAVRVNNGSFYLWGGQQEVGSVATPYQANATTASNGSFIPGRIGTGLDAAGNTKTLAAGEPGPYSLIYANRWNAPKLVIGAGITSATAWAKTTAVQATSPADTKFRNTTKGTKNIVVVPPAAGADKTNLENYVST